MLAEVNAHILKPALVNGVAISSLYGVLAIALVLTFRMSRTVAFVHGGIASFAGYLYWWMAAASSSQFHVLGWRRRCGPWAAPWPAWPGRWSCR